MDRVERKRWQAFYIAPLKNILEWVIRKLIISLLFSISILGLQFYKKKYKNYHKFSN